MTLQLDKKTRIKAWILLAAVLLGLLIPIRHVYKDGKTVSYRAMLYSVTKWDSEAVENHRTGKKTGTQVKILVWDVYDTVTFVPDDIETTLSPAK